jgi:hypothetical protein
MGRVREKKRWMKEVKWRERRRRDQPPFNPVLHLPLLSFIINISNFIVALWY